MSEPVEKSTAYEDFCRLPKHAVGEIVDGELIVTSRSSRKRAHVAFAVACEIGPSYGFGKNGGPGGWSFLTEPEIGFDGDILVPDLAGWVKERFPVAESSNRILTPPDWICEILPPGTARNGRVRKMHVHALHGVRYAWLIDPEIRTLEVYALEADRWITQDVFAGNNVVLIEPFQETEIDLGNLWSA